MKKTFKYLFITILALFSLGQLERIQLNEVISFYIHDLFIIIWLILIISKYHAKLFSLIKRYFLNKLIYTFIAWICLGLIISFIRYKFSIIPLLYIARTGAYLLFALTLQLIKPFSLKTSRFYWTIVGLIIAITGLAQYLLLPDTRFLRYLGWDDHYYRLIGTQLDPNFTGIILTITFLITQGLETKQKWLKNMISALLAGSILLTYSRASFLSFIIGCGLLIFIGFLKSHKKQFSLLIIMGLFILTIPFLPRPDGEGVKLERTASIYARISSNQHSLANLNKYEYIFGKGLFTSTNHNQKQTPWPNTARFPSNLIIFLFTSTGIIGLSLSVVVLTKIGHYLYDQDIYLFSAFIAILIHAQFNHTLFQPFLWLWLTMQIFTIRTLKT